MEKLRREGQLALKAAKTVYNDPKIRSTAKGCLIELLPHPIGSLGGGGLGIGVAELMNKYIFESQLPLTDAFLNDVYGFMVGSFAGISAGVLLQYIIRNRK